jgi:hypothetical protein
MTALLIGITGFAIFAAFTVYCRCCGHTGAALPEADSRKPELSWEGEILCK